MGLAFIAYIIATPIASSICGPILENVGYYGIFGIAAGGNLVPFFYIIIFVPETESD